MENMCVVIGKQNLNLTVRRLDIRHEAFAARLRPGHFVTLAAAPRARAAAYHVLEVDFRRRCFSVVVEESDELSGRMGALRINDTIYAVGGPYGAAIPLEKKGTVIVVSEELGLVSLLALARGLKGAGNKVIGIAGFASRKAAVLESQLRLSCTRAHMMHKDGMHERKGSVLDPLGKILQEESPARIYADVSSATLAGIRVLAAGKGVPVSVSLMPLLQAAGHFDAGSSFVIGGRRYFPAVDGVIVDAQSVDVKEAARAAESTREYFACRKKEALLSRRRGVFARLKKLFWA